MKKTIYFRFISILIFCFLIWNFIGWPFKLRFTMPSLNYWFVIAMLGLIPVLIFLNGNFKNKFINLGFMVFGILLTIPNVIIGFLVYTEIPDINANGFDPSHFIIQEVQKENVFYRLYRLNGGATTSYALELTKEINLSIGLKTVDDLFYKYAAREGKIEEIDSKSIKLTIEPYYSSDKRLEVLIRI